MRQPLLLTLVAACGLLTLASSLRGQTSDTWNNFSGVSANFGTATSWLDGSAPVASPDLTLNFNASPLFAGVSGFTATNNLGTFVLNRLNAGMQGAAISAPLVISNTLATDFLRFAATTGGTLPEINQSGTMRLSIRHAIAATVGLSIDASELRIKGAGLGDVFLDASISATNAANKLVIDMSGTRAFGTAAMVRLGGTNSTFAGGVDLNAGNLIISNVLGTNGAVTGSSPVTVSSLGAGPLTINGGTVQFDATASSLTFVVPNNVVLNQTMRIVGSLPTGPTGNVAGVFAGVLSGTGGLAFSQVNSNQTVAFTGASTFSGAVTVAPVGNTVSTLQLGTSTAAGGSFANVTSYTVTSNSSMTLNNLVGAATRLNTVTPPSLTLNRANLNLLGSGSLVAEAFGPLTVNGTAALNVYGISGGTQAVLTFASLDRGLDGKGTLLVAGTSLGLGAGNEGIVRITSDPSGAVGAGGGTGTTTRSILPYAIINSAATIATASGLGTTTTAGNNVVGLARWDSATQRLLPLNASTEYATNPFTAPRTGTQANLRLASTSATPLAFGAAGLDAASGLSVNSLVLDTNTTTTPSIGVSIGGRGTLTVAGGAVLSGFNGSTGTAPTNPSMINVGTLVFGGSTGYLHAATALTINSAITGTAGLVKAQFFGVILNGLNSFTGGLYLNSGNLQFYRDASLGAAGQPLILNGGVTSSLTYQASNLHALSSSAALTVSRPITLGPSGTSLSVPHVNTPLTLSSVISGSGAILKTGSGILTLSGANTFTGNVTVQAGTLRVGSDAALGNVANGLILAGGTVESAASFSTARDVLVTGSPLLFTPGTNHLTLTGNLTSQISTPALVKDGPADLTLTAANAFTGVFQLGTSIPAIRGSATAPTTAGRVILSGPDGSLAKALNISALFGSVVLDNTAAVNTDRIGNASIVLGGGSLVLRGNAAASMTETTGGIALSTTAIVGGTLTVEQPDSGGAGRSTTLVVSSVPLSTASGTLFVRGTNLGAASGDRGIVLVNSSVAPALTNGLLPALVGANSITAEPQTFLTTSSTTNSAPNNPDYSLVPFTAYTTASGALGTGSTTATYDVTGAASFSGAASANALRISPGGSLDVPSGSSLNLSTGAAHLLSTGGGTRGNITGGGSIAWGTQPARFTITSDSPLSIDPAMTVNGGFYKSGDGQLTLNGAVTGASIYIIAGGSLRQGISGAIPTTATLTLNAGATYDLGGFDTSVASISGFGTVALGPNSLTLTSTSSTVYGGSLSGSGTLIRQTTTASASASLLGASPGFSGDVRILGGTLTIGSAASLGTGTSPILLGHTSGTAQAILSLDPAATGLSRAITVQAGSTPATAHALNLVGAGLTTISSDISLGQTLRLQGSGGTGILSGAISGAGGLYFFSGNWSVSGANTYSGGTTLDISNSSWVGAGHDQAFGTGSITFSAGVGTGFGTNLRADGGPRTLANNLISQFSTPNTGIIGFTGTNPLTLNGTLDLSAANVPQNILVTNTALTTLGGVISNGTGGLIKNGPGVLELKAANLYTGPTVINAGELLITNTTGSAIGGGTNALTIQPGAILSGTGTANTTTTTVDGMIAIGNTQLLSPAASSLTVAGAITLNASSVLKFDLFTGAGAGDNTSILTASDLLLLSGDVSLLPGATLIVENPNAMTAWAAGDMWRLWSGPGTRTGSYSLANIIAPALSGSLVWDFNSTTGVLSILVPEPSKALLVMLGLFGAVLRRRR